MELRQIKYFLAVAQSGGVRKASQLLHVTQPAISRQISELEAELGLKLFSRESRRLSLTPAGEYYRDQMMDIMGHIERASQTVKRVATGSAGRLNLGSVEAVLWDGLVPTHLRQFREDNPGIVMEMVTDNTIALLEHIERGTLDCAFVYLFQGLGSTFETIELRRDPMLLAYPASWHEDLSGHISVEQLNSLPFIRFPRVSYPEFFDWQEQKFQSMGLSPNVCHWAHHESSMLALVSAGQGVSIVNSRHIARAPTLIHFAPLDDLELNLPLCFVRKRDRMKPVVERLSNQLTEDLKLCSSSGR
ncbi:putative Transcriptional regulator LysR family [Vibrio nigripulchritudo SFn27]|uniref:Bacterial regulatory protein, LysR n=1 Tax=Vibrio nigripulchritudo TaxID=28173 RepID=A0A9P1JL84_9VIBR|nr:LysR family transcriptional regulator [Vibrio nigripulchritudo]CBJ93119.1 Putative Bacterial regulatory protein, LysR [Vibrio nigripulchritudo]CCN85934.1 putative Transcriptional regulator LysR family [Vibrio nigripulchritudo BLFn1]CCN91931.1 putative Transcriptional regulator LysR family [Vibrio nigripulchritudo SFn27]CCN97731.1 putative Transcriptional regulator LysR family [Vibrio nigripulchritudo ENn2]CCO43965.1 putative Transcriptional regulator LysR family [Vibrio nigripulchritudo SFn